MLIVNSNGSTEIIDTREKYKIEYKQSYLVSKNIQCAGYTHNIKTIKEIRVTRSEIITSDESK